MEKYFIYSVEDFATDLPFIKWALNKEKNIELEVFYEKYPHKRDEMDEAVDIVRSLDQTHIGMKEREVFLLWKKIKKQYHSDNKSWSKRFLKYAAILVLALGIGTHFYLQFDQSIVKDNFFKDSYTSQNSNQFTLTLSNGNVVPIQSDTANLKYNSSGDKVKIDSKEVPNKTNEQASLNELTVPYGKRSHITLSDGTEIWVNSGSQVMYHSVFTEEERIVYLKGEAYFNVAKNEAKPFIVKTSDLDIQVLGTSFNVNSYEDDKKIHAVVVEGKIRVRKNGIHVFDNDIVLTKSYGVTFDKKNKKLKKEIVDPQYYTSWIEGYMYLNNEPLENIVHYLTRIYNKEITISDEIKSLRFNGKLDLKEDLESELKIIQSAYPIHFIINNEKVFIEPFNF